MPAQQLVIVYAGELAADIAEQVVKKQPAAAVSSIKIIKRRADERPKTLLDYNDATTTVCFLLQTIENGAATEDGGACVRFFKRKTHPDDLLKSKFQFTVFGLGDSNLLLDRQTTGAADCNQVAQELDARLNALGGTRCYELGMADERTGLTEVEPWIDGLWASLVQQQQS